MCRKGWRCRMPLVPASIMGLAQSKASSLTLSGDKLQPLVSAIANATAAFIMSSGTSNPTCTVLGPGAGTFTGQIIGLTPSGMSGQMKLLASPQGLTGRDIGKLFDSISFGVVQAMKSVIVIGAVVGGGPGIGQGKVLGIVAKGLEAQILGMESVKVIGGDKLRPLVSCIAGGICNHITQAATVMATCVGAFAGPPAGPVTIPGAPATGKLA
jgi:hypothetical protein